MLGCTTEAFVRENRQWAGKGLSLKAPFYVKAYSDFHPTWSNQVQRKQSTGQAPVSSFLAVTPRKALSLLFLTCDTCQVHA